MDMSVLKQNKISKIIYIAVLAVYTVALLYLYYHQMLGFIYGPEAMFESDTAVHVSFAVYSGYYHSLAAFIYLFCVKIFGVNIGIVLITAVLTAVTILAIPLTGSLICEGVARTEYTVPLWAVRLISVLANIHVAFYIAAANKQHYIGYQCANMWHNSTYLFMRLFAILTLIAFLRIYDGYEEGIKLSKWITFTLLLTVTTGFKASFLTVFAPLLAVLLLRDLLYGEKFKRVLGMAASVILPIIVMIIQSIVMSGTSGSNGYSIRPFYALSMRGDHPKATLVLSVAFPLLLLFIHINDFFRDKYYFWTWVLWAIGFAEVFLFIETGERAKDSNFMWGYSISLFFLFLMSMIKLVRDLLSKETGLVRRVLCFATVPILLWHAISGIWYFSLLLTGVTYFV
ncbi:MAG: hypothetical protein J5626_10245 [Lachnospiraceae bacterium]|nr:hypothetical protein [Lachnospiraceae bacterium]